MKISRFIYNLLLIPRRIRQSFFVRLNRIYFRLAGVRLGKDFRANNRVYLTTFPNSHFCIGDNFIVLSGDNFNSLSRNIRSSFFVADNAKLIIGNHSGVSSVCIWANEKITIGNYVKIGANSILIDTDAHSLDWRIRKTSLDWQFANKAPIMIGDGVLIGTGCIILKGVTIGEHSIIGAGSVVSKDIPANCIAAGNPAKVIKYLEEN